MGEFFLSRPKDRDHWRLFSHYIRMGIMGDFSLTTKGWGSWESFLSLPNDRDHVRVFSHYQRMGIIGEYSLTTKG